MIKVEKREEIQRAYFVEEKSIRQIAREFTCSRPTVRKAIESAEPERYTLKGPRSASVLGPYKARIDELLAENERLPRKQRYTGHKIYKTIQQEGYTGSESSVRGYIAQRLPLFMWRVLKQRLALSLPVLSVVDGSKGVASCASTMLEQPRWGQEGEGSERRSIRVFDFGDVVRYNRIKVVC